MRVFHIIGWILLGMAGVVAIGLVAGLGVQLLWNWLMPQIFGLSEVTFWQAVGLFILFHILVGGHHGHHAYAGKKPGWSKFRDKLHGELHGKFIKNGKTESPAYSE